VPLKTLNGAAMADVELNDYRLLLQELKALMPAKAPEAIDVQD
jgi:hypothetical protein